MFDIKYILDYYSIPNILSPGRFFQDSVYELCVKYSPSQAFLMRKGYKFSDFFGFNETGNIDSGWIDQDNLLDEIVKWIFQ